MPYAGRQVMMRDVAHEVRELGDMRNYELTKACAVAYAESHDYLGAWHDNVVESETVGHAGAAVYTQYGPPAVTFAEQARPVDDWVARMLEDMGKETGQVISRDCGIYEFNIPASQIGTEMEFALRTESLDPAVYMPVLRNSVKKMYAYYNSPWERNGKLEKRRWQAWMAYTSGWAMFPYAWVWHRDIDHNPVGPWLRTGRYIFYAIAGQMNNLVVNEKLWSPEMALTYAKKYAAHFEIKDGSDVYLGKDARGNMIVKWRFAPAPTAPPEDGAGPYPQSNNGV